ncbi:hypothetical protein BT96DRAFT_925168 [Gymnopus androsaceus JB14]|uniref:Uncharacterized protein n=1 Tax=Gymnopus androsaceus JB14 TaxID=1447944 RepID=A0A6A4H0D5_9AGAR|nr:hypothetical protein BT96DRAFT_925168 [Gymnopus androsaceus JB14]
MGLLVDSEKMDGWLLVLGNKRIVILKQSDTNASLSAQLLESFVTILGLSTETATAVTDATTPLQFRPYLKSIPLSASAFPSYTP